MIAAALLLPAAVQAQTVKLMAGEDVVFALHDGAPAGETRTSAALTEYEDMAGRMLSGLKPPEHPVTEGVPITHDSRAPAAPEPEPGKLRFRFFRLPGSAHSLLVVQNGYSQALLYRARISSRGKTSPTDVCLVIPGKSGFEHWPYAIETIEVSGFELVDWKPEDGIPCK